MFSPARYYKKIPKDPVKNVRLRLALLGAARKDPRLQRAIVARCQDDIFFWINLFVLQANPKSLGMGSTEIGPFICWPFQEEGIRLILGAIVAHKDVVLEKSRDMGASWVTMIIATWILLFQPSKEILVISRKEEAVDKPGHQRSLFAKIDFILEHLPAWMKPAIKRRKLSFVNEDNRSSILGESTTGSSGVSDRTTVIFVDEMAHIDDGYAIIDRTSDTSGCRVFVSTHMGEATAFYHLTNIRAEMNRHLVHLVWHWSQHPDKVRGAYRFNQQTGQAEVLDKKYKYPPDFRFVTDGTPSGGPFPGLRSPWYDIQCGKKTSQSAIAQDLDIDPAGSTTQLFDPVYIRWYIGKYTRPPDWEGYLEYDLLGRPQKLVQQKGAPLKLWCHLGADGKPPASLWGIGWDISNGRGRSPSCGSILNLLSGEKAGEYVSSQIEPHELAPLAVALCWLFQAEGGEGARLAWEAAGPGVNFGDHVLQLGYQKILWTEPNPIARPGVFSNVPGWKPTVLGKEMILREYMAALRALQFLNRSVAALEECLQFQIEGGKIIHAADLKSKFGGGHTSPGEHGDRVIADAIAWRLCRIANQLGGNVARPAPEVARPGSYAWRRQLRQKDQEARQLWA